MRALLINPFYPISETPSPPLGLAYLAAALEAAGAEVRLLDYVVYPFDEPWLANVLDRFEPHLVGVTAVTMTVDNALHILKTVRRLRPDIPTVMGGPHATFAARETLQSQPELDLVVLGEGERTIVELIRALAAGADPETVAGIAYRRGREIRFTAARPLIGDLDDLPAPARHLLPLGRYRALGMPISLTTSRGCPHQCIFCVGRRMVGSRVRYRSPRLVVDELAAVADLGFHQINLADDLFTANRRHCLAVCDEIERRRLKVKWTSFARVDTVTFELLRRMRSAGCTAVSFGIESGSPAILKTVKKGITREQVVAAVEMCTRAGVTPFASFILGLPGETEATIAETLAFGDQLKASGLLYGFHLLAPFPGTEIRDRAEEYGIRILTDDWSQYHANRAIVETPNVDRERLDEIVVAWEHEFNHLLAAIADRIAAGTATPEERDQLTGLERIVMLYDLMMGRVIEAQGTWPLGETAGRNGDDLDTLVTRILSVHGVDAEKLAEALAHAAARGNLIRRERDGRVCWQWRDHLDTTRAAHSA